MHPTTAMHLAKARAHDLEAEADRVRLAKSVRPLQPDEEHAAHWGLRLRRVIPLLHGKAAGAATA
jgi:hypothetical protein